MQIIQRKPLVTAVLLAMSASAMAEEAKQTFTLDKVTVAATLTEQKVGDVANTVTVIDAEQMEQNAATDIRDILRYEPGVEVSSAGRFGLSGFNIRGMDANRVKILVDGVEQAKDFNSGGPFLRGTRNFVDVDSLKQVDIVKGPASSLYGSDALGGVVAFTTKDAEDYLADGDDTAVNIKAMYHSVDQSFNNTLTIANRSGNLESLLVYTHRDGEEHKNFEDGYEGGQGNERTLQDPADFETNNILGKLAYQLNDQNKIGLTIEHHKTNTKTHLLSLEGPTYSTTFNYQDYYGDDTLTRNRVGIWHNLEAETALFDTLAWSLDWQESLTEQDTLNYTDFFGYGNRLIDYSNEEESLQFNVQFNKTFNNHAITYGAKYLDNSFENATDKYYLDGTYPDDIARYTPVVEGESFGVFIQDQISLLGDQLIVTPGIRYDSFSAKPTTDNVYTTEFNEHDSDSVTGRLGVVYKLNETYSVFGQFSQGFKAPDLTQLYREDYDSWYRGYATASNPDLKPEESNAFELGFRAAGDFGNIEVSAFYNDYKDFIAASTDDFDYPFPGNTIELTTYENIGEAEVKGIEARASIWLDKTLGAPAGTAFHASLAYADGEGNNQGEEVQPLDEIAPLKAVFGLQYDNPTGKWGSNINWTLVEEKDKNDVVDETDATTAGFGIVDINGYINLTDRFIIRGGIYNLTDKEYSLWEDLRHHAVSESSTYLTRYTQPGRNISVSASYEF